MAFTWARQQCDSTAIPDNSNGCGNISSIMVRDGTSIMGREGCRYGRLTQNIKRIRRRFCHV
jgi:hypothetical protein